MLAAVSFFDTPRSRVAANPTLVLDEAMHSVTEADGIAAIAHPARYKLKPHGGRGVEIVTCSHSAAEAVRCAEMARERLPCGRESRTELGSLPDLPGTLTPVWMALESRVSRPQ